MLRKSADHRLHLCQQDILFEGVFCRYRLRWPVRNYLAVVDFASQLVGYAVRLQGITPGLPCSLCYGRDATGGQRMVIRPGVAFRRPECVVCRKSLGKDRVWKQRQGSLCRKCKRDLENLAKAGTQRADGNRLPFRFGLFDSPEDLARAEEIWNKCSSELTSGEREWVDGVMNFILRPQSPRGRKGDAENERIERLLVRLALVGKPRPSYGQIAELLMPRTIEKFYQRDRILQALKRRRIATQLQSPPSQSNC